MNPNIWTFYWMLAVILTQYFALGYLAVTGRIDDKTAFPIVIFETVAISW